MNAQELIAALGERLGLRDWAVDAQGACALSFPDGLRVELRFIEGRSGVCLVATLGELTRASRSEVVAGLLLANRSFSEQGDPWFALDRPSGAVHLCRTLSFAGQSPESVFADLEHLVVTARGFRHRLLEQQQVIA